MSWFRQRIGTTVLAGALIASGIAVGTPIIASAPVVSAPASRWYEAPPYRTGSNGIAGVLRLAGGSGITILGGPACQRWAYYPDFGPALEIPLSGSTSTRSTNGLGLADAIWTLRIDVVSFEDPSVVEATTLLAEDQLWDEAVLGGYAINLGFPAFLLVPVDDPAAWLRYSSRVVLTFTALLPGGATYVASDHHTFDVPCSPYILPPALTERSDVGEDEHQVAAGGQLPVDLGGAAAFARSR